MQQGTVAAAPVGNESQPERGRKQDQRGQAKPPRRQERRCDGENRHGVRAPPERIESGQRIGRAAGGSARRRASRGA